MSEIDWSNAPEGYPIWLEYSSSVASSRGRSGEWVREDEENYWTQRGTYWSKPDEGFYIAHYRPSSPAWNGEGWPPVGAVFELSIDPEKDDDYPINKWLRGDRLDVIAYRFVGGKELPIVWNERHQSASSVLFECFRPLRTPEQIAAEEREKAVAEMLKSVHGGVVQCAIVNNAYQYIKDACKDLYDAGYRKTGEGK